MLESSPHDRAQQKEEQHTTSTNRALHTKEENKILSSSPASSQKRQRELTATEEPPNEDRKRKENTKIDERLDLSVQRDKKEEGEEGTDEKISEAEHHEEGEKNKKKEEEDCYFSYVKSGIEERYREGIPSFHATKLLRDKYARVPEIRDVNIEIICCMDAVQFTQFRVILARCKAELAFPVKRSNTTMMSRPPTQNEKLDCNTASTTTEHTDTAVMMSTHTTAATALPQDAKNNLSSLRHTDVLPREPMLSSSSSSFAHENLVWESLHFVGKKSDPKENFELQSVWVPEQPLQLQCYPRIMIHFCLTLHAMERITRKLLQHLFSLCTSKQNPNEKVSSLEEASGEKRKGKEEHKKGGEEEVTMGSDVLDTAVSLSKQWTACAAEMFDVDPNLLLAQQQQQHYCESKYGAEVKLRSETTPVSPQDVTSVHNKELFDGLPSFLDDILLPTGDIAVLGLGGNVIANFLHRLFPSPKRKRIHVVEIEPSVVKACVLHGLLDPETDDPESSCSELRNETKGDEKNCSRCRVHLGDVLQLLKDPNSSLRRRQNGRRQSRKEDSHTTRSEYTQNISEDEGFGTIFLDCFDPYAATMMHAVDLLSACRDAMAKSFRTSDASSYPSVLPTHLFPVTSMLICNAHIEPSEEKLAPFVQVFGSGNVHCVNIKGYVQCMVVCFCRAEAAAASALAGALPVVQSSNKERNGGDGSNSPEPPQTLSLSSLLQGFTYMNIQNYRRVTKMINDAISGLSSPSQQQHLDWNDNDDITTTVEKKDSCICIQDEKLSINDLDNACRKTAAAREEKKDAVIFQLDTDFVAKCMKKTFSQKKKNKKIQDQEERDQTELHLLGDEDEGLKQQQHWRWWRPGEH